LLRKLRNNENLSRLAGKIISPLMFAHVRAAYPGMPVSEQNCKSHLAHMQHGKFSHKSLRKKRNWIPWRVNLLLILSTSSSLGLACDVQAIPSCLVVICGCTMALLEGSQRLREAFWR
jgi:hypothetical protein